MNTRLRHIVIALVLSLGLLMSLLAVMSRFPIDLRIARAASQGVARYVATSGTDSGDCTNSASPCRTVQYAVDQADNGDEVRIAAGTYSGVQNRSAPLGYIGSTVITQSVYIVKSVALRGGYTTTNWTTPDPVANPVTLDAGNQGRVVFIIGLINPTLEGLRLTRGNAAGLLGSVSDPVYGPTDVGGGVYAVYATVAISNCWVVSSTAGGGGGLALGFGTYSLAANHVISNQANNSGGILFAYSTATLRDSDISSNRAVTDAGGIAIYGGNVTLVGNSIISNTAGRRGGGLGVMQATAQITGNSILSNTATYDAGGIGVDHSAVQIVGNQIMGNQATNNEAGGIGVDNSSAQIISNTVSGNQASLSAGGIGLKSSPTTTISANGISHNTAFIGGGLGLDASAAQVVSNTISANQADMQGGGIELSSSAATLSGNTVLSNTSEFGGGVYLQDSPAYMADNLIATNVATSTWMPVGWGGGVYLQNSNSTLSRNRIHLNLAMNDGGGVYVSSEIVTFTANSVLSNTADGASSSGGGIYVNGGASSLISNTFAANSAGLDGGGIYLGSSASSVDQNIVFSNTAASYGGGLYVDYGNNLIQRNRVMSNTAPDGGGLAFNEAKDNTLVNNLIAANDAPGGATCGGGALMVWHAGPQALHNTLTSNTGSNGVCVRDATLQMTNTIIVSHTTGVYVSGGSARLEGMLWFGNGANTGGDVVTVTNAYTGTPAFAADGYHLTSSSTAIDKGVSAGVTDDIDNEPRPNNLPDLGADEYWPCIPISEAGIMGPVSGTVDSPLAFAAVITPSNATPTIGYTWVPAPNIGQGTAVATYTFGLPDQHEIQLTAQNCGGSVQVSRTVQILPTLPITPTLLSPPDGTVTATQAITLTWQPGAGGTPEGYNVQLDNAIFTTSNTFSPTLLAYGVHTWTVRAYNASGASAWAAAWTFEIRQYKIYVPVVLRQ